MYEHNVHRNISGEKDKFKELLHLCGVGRGGAGAGSDGRALEDKLPGAELDIHYVLSPSHL